MGRKSIYLNRKGGHKASTIELIIFQLLPNPIDIGHAKTPQGILGTGHGGWGKHEPL